MLYWFVFSPLLISAVLVVGAWLYGAVFLRGYRDGLERGKALGKRHADAEWAVWAEHGAL